MMLTAFALLFIFSVVILCKREVCFILQASRQVSLYCAVELTSDPKAALKLETELMLIQATLKAQAVSLKRWVCPIGHRLRQDLSRKNQSQCLHPCLYTCCSRDALQSKQIVLMISGDASGEIASVLISTCICI